MPKQSQRPQPPGRRAAAAREPRESAVDDDDRQLRRQIVADIARRDLNHAGTIRIDVTDRLVTIHGQVKSADDKQAVLETVRRVPGIIDVHDGLTINPLLKRQQTPPSKKSNSSTWLTLTAVAVLALLAGLLLWRGHQSTRQRGSELPIAAALAAAGSMAPPALRPKTVPKPPIELYPARGHVTFKGTAANGAYVVLHPLHGPLPREAKPSAHVAEDGSFQLGTYNAGDGAPAGEYAVTVVWRSLDGGDEFTTGPSLLPARYGNPATSGLRATITPEGIELPPFRLTN